MRWPRLPEPERDLDGLPIVGRGERRLALALTIVASLWFAAAAAWEMFGPLLAGHYAASASQGIVADNMLRWGILGPVWEYTGGPPSPSQYYCHHPWGTFWTTALFAEIFGRHDFVCRLPAVLCSAITPPLLYLLGRALWRPAAGAVAAAAFVVLPITLSFANFNALEVPVIAWTTLGCWAFVRHQQTFRRRYLGAGLLGFALALHADWPAFVLLGVLLAAALAAGILWRRPLHGRVLAQRGLRAHAIWWALAATLAVATVVFYLAVFHSAGKLDDLLRSYSSRSRGAELPLSAVLRSRRYWIELMFTPVAIGLGKVAAVVAIARLLVLRKPLEIVPLAVLAMATVQYVAFKQGADIHIYWPHYFAQFFALAMALMVATALAAIAALRPQLAKSERLVYGCMALALVPLLLVLRDGAVALRMARQTGGRFNEKGLLIHSDGDKIAFLRWLSPQLPTEASIALHEGMKPDWSQVWSLGGRVVRGSRPLPGGASSDHYLADTRFLLDPLQAQLAAGHHVVAVGPFWWVSPSGGPAPIDAYSFTEREPSPASWYFISGTEPQREITPDPFQTWELRFHFEQPATAPTAEPVTFEQIRIAHNAARATGDDARARALLARLSEALGPPSGRLDDGTELFGARYRDGVRPLLYLVLRAAGPSAHDLMPVVKAEVLSSARWSTTMADPTLREAAIPMSIAPLRWRAGFLYGLEIPILERPGRERFALSFRLRHSGRPQDRGARPPRWSDGNDSLTVLELD